MLVRPQHLSLHLRWPAWVPAGELRTTINGQELAIEGRPGEYFTVARSWQSGDRMVMSLPMHYRVEPLAHSKDFAAFFRGPVLLAGALGSEKLDPTDFFSANGDPIPRKSLPIDDCPSLVGVPAKAAEVLENLSGLDGLHPSTGKATEPPDVPLLPVFRLHRQRYAIYWPVRDQKTAVEIRDRRQSERQEEESMESRTIDRVLIADDASEKNHHFQGARTETGVAQWPYTRWRHAQGWFAYDLKLESGVPAALRCVFWGGDIGRTFDVMVEGKTIGRVELEAQRPGEFLARIFDLSPDVTDGKTRVTVRFQARPGSLAGGLFDLRTVRRKYAP